MTNSKRFSDKAVLITGASRGLGAALAQTLASAGARVVLVARQEAPLVEQVEAIRSRGGQAFALPADVADQRAIYPLAGAAAELVGPIDVLIHNASELGPTPLSFLLDTECEELERVLAVNLVGPFRLTRAIAGSMVLRRTGTIVFVSSDAAVEAYPRWGAYAVSKAAADHLARVLAAELEPHGPRVFSVDPGEMNTVMHAAALPDADPEELVEPSVIAERIASMIESPGAPTGTRQLAREWEVGA